MELDYARVSTAKQDLDRQVDALTAVGIPAERIYLDKNPALAPTGADGSFRYGLRGSKIAQLADYSLATVRRAQRYLIAHGFLVCRQGR